MAKLTNNGSANAFEKAPESGVDFHLSFWKEERESGDGKTEWASLFNARSKETAILDSPDIGPCLWLGHINRMEGRTNDEPTYNVYSTYFEKYDDFIQIWKKRVDDQEAKAQLVYTGKANDEAAKKEMKYLIAPKSGYTIYLLLISQKGKLIFAKLDGMNIDKYFDFQKTNPDAEFIQIDGLTKEENPKKKDKFVHLLNFVVPEKGPEFSPEQQKAVFEKIEQLQIYLDHQLYYARNGQHKDSPSIPQSSGPAPFTPAKAPVRNEPEPPELHPEAILTGEGLPAPVTPDDDLPF